MASPPPTKPVAEGDKSQHASDGLTSGKRRMTAKALDRARRNRRDRERVVRLRECIDRLRALLPGTSARGQADVLSNTVSLVLSLQKEHSDLAEAVLARDAACEQLRRSAGRIPIAYSRVFANSGVPQALAHVNGTPLDANIALLQLAGITREEFRSGSIFTFTTRGDMPKFYSSLAKAIADPSAAPVELTKVSVYKAGRVRVHVILKPIRPDPASPPTHILGTLLPLEWISAAVASHPADAAPPPTANAFATPHLPEDHSTAAQMLRAAAQSREPPSRGAHAAATCTSTSAGAGAGASAGAGGGYAAIDALEQVGGRTEAGGSVSKAVGGAGIHPDSVARLAKRRRTAQMGDTSAMPERAGAIPPPVAAAPHYPIVLPTGAAGVDASLAAAGGATTTRYLAPPPPPAMAPPVVDPLQQLQLPRELYASPFAPPTTGMGLGMAFDRLPVPQRRPWDVPADLAFHFHAQQVLPPSPLHDSPAGFAAATYRR